MHLRSKSQNTTRILRMCVWVRPRLWGRCFVYTTTMQMLGYLFLRKDLHGNRHNIWKKNAFLSALFHPTKELCLFSIHGACFQFRGNQPTHATVFVWQRNNKLLLLVHFYLVQNSCATETCFIQLFAAFCLFNSQQWIRFSFLAWIALPRNLDFDCTWCEASDVFRCMFLGANVGIHTYIVRYIIGIEWRKEEKLLAE
jgi:hypothetical protein